MAEPNEQPPKPTTQCTPNYAPTTPIQQSITTILKSIKHDLSLCGVISLGRDGVLRSLTADRTVVDAIGLTPDQITAFLSRVPAGYGNPQEFEGADGTKVPEEQWWKPDRGLLPEPMPAETERVRKAMESEPERWKERVEELEKAWKAKGDL